jgi:hypothetical protein
MEQLRKEVETPQKHSNGVGLMLVASAAMLFAVAGSAFIVRARMAQNCCVHAHEMPSRVVVVEPAASVPEVTKTTVKNCGDGVFVSNNDGSQSVHFNLCAPDAVADPTIRGVEVHRVVIE